MRRLLVITGIIMLLFAGTAGPVQAGPGDELIPIRSIQFTTASDGASPLAGQTVTTRGIVTAVYRQGYVIAEPAGGPWSGIYVYDPEHRPSPGDELHLRARVEEYYGLTELTDVQEYALLASAHPLPPAQRISCAEMAAEAYESVLVDLGPVSVRSAALDFGNWEVSDGAGTARVGNRTNLWYLPHAGDMLSFLRGVVFFSYDAFKLEPRGDEDIGLPPPAPFALHGTVLTPETVIPNAYVVVQGQYIADITADHPVGMRIVEAGGLILPGLVNAHDHPPYNIFPEPSFGQTFPNRYAWQSHPIYRAFRERFSALQSQGLTCEMWKYAEVRALIAGSTTQQGAYPSEYWTCYAHPRVLVRNPERMNPALRSEVFPLGLSETERETIRRRVTSGAYTRIIIHLSEGTDDASLAEFATWQGWGLLPASVIIHGIPYGPAEFQAMLSAGASLVWSPHSNLRLYGATLDPRPALALGLKVSLAPDWTLTGSYDILRELNTAEALNRERFAGAVPAASLVEMVTTNPAGQLGLEGQLGRIAPGYLADMMVLAGAPGDPYTAVTSARAQDVQLVLIGGEAVYGREPLIAALYGPDAGEPITVCGE
ncbi:MAG: amidohydrolase family protein, partial [Anaerolineae bacterium]